METKVRLAAEKAAAEKQEQLAALSVPAAKLEQQAVIDLPRALQAELRRVGCSTGAVDGNWSVASQKALDLFDNLESQMANVPSFDLVADGMAHDMLLIIRTDLQK